MVTRLKRNINGVDYTLETGRLANQSQAAVLAQAGDTVVLTTVNVGPDVTDIDFFPLSVDYVEKLYAAGLISTSRFIKREGRPSDKEILSSRLLDRSCRSLFPEDFVREVQIITQVLAYDQENDPEILQGLSASVALLLAGVPFKGPMMIVRSGLVNNELVYFPSDKLMDESEMNLMISVTENSVVSIDAEGKMISDEVYFKALENSVEKGKDFLEFQKEFVKEAGVKEFSYTPRVVPTELKEKVEGDIKERLEAAAFIKDKKTRNAEIGILKDEMHTKYDESFNPGDVSKAFEDIQKEIIRRNAIKNKKRLDGRALDELRPISAEVGVLPRVHGSAIFNRGETQVMSIVTLGSSSLSQVIEGIDGEESKRYMHHYNFPGYSVGEVDRKFGMPNRRAIGHGMIGEKSLYQVLPDQENFKYTIRVVSEVLSSNGSTSMAATCGSTLALMDAGVPIKDPIGRISMGLIYEGEDKYVLLTDIIGDEDHYGDMDYKITGNRDGWTAIQLDNKLQGIPVNILVEATKQSKIIRNKILDMMNSIISSPRSEMSEYAPRITTVKIDQSKIGELIGPGGKVIKEIIAQSGAEIDIEDDGSVNIAAVTQESSEKAVLLIREALNEIEPGTILPATIKRVENYGAFIEVNKNFGGLVHVSKLSDEFVKDPQQVVKVGQKVKVRFEGKDDQGRYNFSMKGVGQE